MGWAGRHLWLPDREEIIGVRSVCPQVPPQVFPVPDFPTGCERNEGDVERDGKADSSPAAPGRNDKAICGLRSSLRELPEGPTGADELLGILRLRLCFAARSTILARDDRG
jgi:hypothetical protein